MSVEPGVPEVEEPSVPAPPAASPPGPAAAEPRDLSAPDRATAPPEVVAALEAAEHLPPAERALALEAVHADLVARLGDVRGA